MIAWDRFFSPSLNWSVSEPAGAADAVPLVIFELVAVPLVIFELAAVPFVILLPVAVPGKIPVELAFRRRALRLGQYRHSSGALRAVGGRNGRDPEKAAVSDVLAIRFDDRGEPRFRRQLHTNGSACRCHDDGGRIDADDRAANVFSTAERLGEADPRCRQERSAEQ